MGGRTTAEGTIDFVSIDHINATALDFATLTPEDPLAGLDVLARQVAATGIRGVASDVVIDDRLFPAMAKDDYIVTPIWINDNLIDLTLTPGAVGAPATLAWRPETGAYQVQSAVETVAAGQPLDVAVTSPEPGLIAISRSMPADHAPLLKVYQVEDPAAFARTLLIEALARQGIAVAATPTGPNPADLLPPAGSYAAADRVALLESPPFSENLKLISKVSHNQHADLLIFLLALKHGETSFVTGMQQIRLFLERIGLDPTAVSLGDGRGNTYTDLFSPGTVSHLLRAMTTQPDFAAYFDALPILGVDGTEVGTMSPTSAVRGKAVAKSGTTLDADLLNDRFLVMTRALAGYMTTRSGRDVTFAIYVNDLPIAQVNDVLSVISEQGTIVEIIFDQN